MKSYFPDVNVWVALAYQGHQHHSAAQAWFGNLDEEIAHFCRITQLSFLRLISHPQVMGEDLMSQSQAWQAYDMLCSDERVSFHVEPDDRQIESTLRKLTSGTIPSSRQWPDAYLAAFAKTAGLTLVTFDKALHQLAKPHSLLLP